MARFTLPRDLYHGKGSLAELKNLSGKRCVPTEFIKQTVKIRKVAEKWLKTTGIIEIIRKEANLIKISDDMSEEEKKEAIANCLTITLIFFKQYLNYTKTIKKLLTNYIPRVKFFLKN